MEAKDLNRIVNSAIWAAYADALGFITELVDKNGVRRRIQSNRVTKTVPWHRKIGGRFGAEINLPAGCYSDDTQLRLCTSRAIRDDGKFDVEAFAKVELPVWLSYSLGAGKGTKAAASSFARPDVNWFSNFFGQKGSSYINAGGNGAAMRIQPHVWASKNRSQPKDFLLDVIRNAICTHGHFRGILGAVFHALCLAESIEKKNIPEPDFWFHTVNSFSDLSKLFNEDASIASFWKPVWEEKAGTSIKDALRQVIDECIYDLKIVEKYLSIKPGNNAYEKIVREIGGLNKNSRGSGIKTAIIAVVLSWIYRNEDYSKAIETAANLLWSDTDTIGTMAGALIGSVTDELPKSPLMDKEYIEKEAKRLFRISYGEISETFEYPDLFKWSPPKTHQDAIGLVKDRLVLSGLGKVEPYEQIFEATGKGKSCWQWFSLDFGQTIIAKRRLEPRTLPIGNFPLSTGLKKDFAKSVTEPNGIESSRPKQTALFGYKDRNKYTDISDHGIKSIDEITNEVIKANFDEKLIGKHLLELATRPNGIENAIAFAVIIAKAKIARTRTHNNKH